MIYEERILEQALNASSSCLLQPLDEDCDSKPIAPADFDNFRLMLDEQFYLLLDILYQNGDLMKSKSFDNQLVQLRVNVFLLYCEQTEPNPFFQTSQRILIDSLTKLTEENIANFDDSVMTKVVQCYKGGLRKDSWKKQLGMIHGFPRFCEIILKRKPELMNADLLLFMLSVGSNLVLHYDPHFKTIGLKIYRILIEHCDCSLMKELNIHQVLYSESFQMLRKSNELDFNDHLFECLLGVAAIEDREVMNSRWCKFDDVLEGLLTQLGTESESKVSLLLLNKLVKFCAMTYDGVDIELHDITLELEQYYCELKSKTSRTNYRTMRWIKRLLHVMITESPKYLNNSSDCYKFIHVIHSIYIVAILNVDPQILDIQLMEYTKKIILSLMQFVRNHKDNEAVKSIGLFLKTIKQHNQENQEFTICLQKLLNHDAFKNFLRK